MERHLSGAGSAGEAGKEIWDQIDVPRPLLVGLNANSEPRFYIMTPAARFGEQHRIAGGQSINGRSCIGYPVRIPYSTRIIE
jgi:hypothetical protein